MVGYHCRSPDYLGNGNRLTIIHRRVIYVG